MRSPERKCFQPIHAQLLKARGLTKHFNWVKAHLCIIEQIGIENYLIEQLGD